MLKNKKLIEKDLLCVILQDDSDSVIKLIKHLDAYINKTASLPLYDAFGNYVGTFISEDLKQDIIFQIITCIPNLKRNIFSKYL